MRYYIIAGEHSGDMHGADLIKQIKKIDPHADFWACGGMAMSQALGRPCNLDGSKMAYMGIDFLKKCYTLWQLLKFCQKGLISYQPDGVILIDYSGFNMRLAAFAKRNGFQVGYYIPPKIWVHGARRMASIKRDVDKVWSILPFEVAYYQAQGYHAIDYVGNPLVQKVADHSINPSFIADHRLDSRPIIALLPGSRVDEVRRLLPLMVAQVATFKDYQFVVAGLRVIPSSLYRAICPSTVRVVYDQTYDLIALSRVGIIASGTASLEAALFSLPQVVVYKTHPLAYLFYKSIVTVKYISLVNLLLDRSGNSISNGSFGAEAGLCSSNTPKYSGDCASPKNCPSQIGFESGLMHHPVVPELIQYQLTGEKLHVALTDLLSGSGSVKQKAAYQAIRQLLGQQNAAVEAARSIVASLKQPT